MILCERNRSSMMGSTRVCIASETKIVMIHATVTGRTARDKTCHRGLSNDKRHGFET